MFPTLSTMANGLLLFFVAVCLALAYFIYNYSLKLRDWNRILEISKKAKEANKDNPVTKEDLKFIAEYIQACVENRQAGNKEFITMSVKIQFLAYGYTTEEQGQGSISEQDSSIFDWVQSTIGLDQSQFKTVLDLING